MVTGEMFSTVVVVIPYFQRDPGLLRRALDSIAAQADVGDVQVLVVDDGSPHPAEPEIRESAIDPASVTVLRQPNAGPAVARNHGLAAVPSDTDFVAFLDSDDEWTAGHLRNAVVALGDDTDFYFANHLEPSARRDAFAWHRRLEKGHVPLDRGSNCYRYVGDMVDQVIIENVIETSTVVFRRDRLGHLRFREDFRSAYEDHLFWIAAANESRGFAFSSDVEVHYGRGVSIWRSIGFGSDRLLPSLLDQRRYYREIDRLRERTDAQRQVVRRRVNEIRDTVMADLLHRLRRRIPVDWKGIRAYLAFDPVLALLAPPIAIRIVLRRIRG